MGVSAPSLHRESTDSLMTHRDAARDEKTANEARANVWVSSRQAKLFSNLSTTILIA